MERWTGAMVLTVSKISSAGIMARQLNLQLYA